jgi:hypothetical protein
MNMCYILLLREKWTMELPLTKSKDSIPHENKGERELRDGKKHQLHAW